MSYGAVTATSIDHRRDRLAEDLVRRTEREWRAQALIAERMPDLIYTTGHVCPWAIASLLELWRERGEKRGAVTPGMVRDRRAEKLRRFSTALQADVRAAIKDRSA